MLTFTINVNWTADQLVRFIVTARQLRSIASAFGS